MDVDLMASSATWAETARVAKDVERAGFSGMLFTESGQTPWMAIAAAAMAAPQLHFSTGIAVAFPRSPMVTAQLAWELAQNTEGRFRLGLGSQVKAHVVRRYGAEFDPPAARLRDYVLAVKACWRAFRGEERLAHDGPYYSLSLLPAAWSPPRHEFGDLRVDISAVGPVTCRVAGEVADGVHVHPLHSTTYLDNRLLPELAAGAAGAGRDVGQLQLIVRCSPFRETLPKPARRCWSGPVPRSRSTARHRTMRTNSTIWASTVSPPGSGNGSRPVIRRAPQRW